MRSSKRLMTGREGRRVLSATRIGHGGL